MRRIKAIHLIPIVLVLLIGAGFAAYNFLFKPQLEKVKAARAAWTAEQTKLREAEKGYQASIDSQLVSATKFYRDYHQFRIIRASMPAIYNMKELYAGREKEGLIVWYKIMGTGKMIAELNHWARSFHQPNAPSFDGKFTGNLGYEDSLPSARMVKVNFGGQSFAVRGYGNLLNAIRRTTGYGYFPLVMDSPDGKTYTVTVDRSPTKRDPKNPLLTMAYKSTAYFFTRGWDPAGTEAAATAQMKDAENLLRTPPQKRDARRDFFDTSQGGAGYECPKVLWYFTQQGLQAN